MSKYCPHCHEEIEHLRFETEITSYGTSWGTCDIDGDNSEEDDCEYNDTDYNNTNYTCPECDAGLDIDDLLDELEGDDEDGDSNDEGEEIVCCANEISVETLTDGGCRIVKRGTFTEEANTNNASRIRTKICPSCKTLNFTENDSAIICINCNAEIIIN